jgi:hypothetical protein
LNSYWYSHNRSRTIYIRIVIIHKKTTSKCDTKHKVKQHKTRGSTGHSFPIDIKWLQGLIQLFSCGLSLFGYRWSYFYYDYINTNSMIFNVFDNVGLVQSIISLKIKLFLPWYSWTHSLLFGNRYMITWSDICFFKKIFISAFYSTIENNKSIITHLQ